MADPRQVYRVRMDAELERGEAGAWERYQNAASLATCGPEEFELRTNRRRPRTRRCDRAWKVGALSRNLRLRSCDTCGEHARGNDPGLSPRYDGAMICAFCGYWGVPPGPERERMREARQ